MTIVRCSSNNELFLQLKRLFIQSIEQYNKKLGKYDKDKLNEAEEEVSTIFELNVHPTELSEEKRRIQHINFLVADFKRVPQQVEVICDNSIEYYAKYIGLRIAYKMPLSMKIVSDHMEPSYLVWNMLIQSSIDVIKKGQIELESPLWNLSIMMSEVSIMQTTPFTYLFSPAVSVPEACTMLHVLVIEFNFLPWQTCRSERKKNFSGVILEFMDQPAMISALYEALRTPLGPLCEQIDRISLHMKASFFIQLISQKFGRDSGLLFKVVLKERDRAMTECLNAIYSRFQIFS